MFPKERPPLTLGNGIYSVSHVPVLSTIRSSCAQVHASTTFKIGDDVALRKIPWVSDTLTGNSSRLIENSWLAWPPLRTKKGGEKQVVVLHATIGPPFSLPPADSPPAARRPCMLGCALAVVCCPQTRAKDRSQTWHVTLHQRFVVASHLPHECSINSHVVNHAVVMIALTCPAKTGSKRQALVTNSRMFSVHTRWPGGGSGAITPPAAVPPPP